VISASAALLGAAITPVTTAYQHSRQAKRDREDQHDAALREACVDLLRAVGDLRDQVANNHDYPGGDEMSARLAQVRQHVTAAKVNSVSIALLAPQALAEPADQLAKAADRLGVTAAKSTDRRVRASNRAPDFGELDVCTATFCMQAVNYARGKPATIRARGRQAAAPPLDAAATAADQ
jgi:hypothetical protein